MVDDVKVAVEDPAPYAIDVVLRLVVSPTLGETVVVRVTVE